MSKVFTRLSRDVRNLRTIVSDGLSFVASEAKGRYRTCERRFQPERRIGPEPQAERWRWSREVRWDRSPSSGLAPARFGRSSRKALELGPSLRLRGNSRRSLPHRES